VSDKKNIDGCCNWLSFKEVFFYNRSIKAKYCTSSIGATCRVKVREQDCENYATPTNYLVATVVAANLEINTFTAQKQVSLRGSYN